jgi:hypothetical protein
MFELLVSCFLLWFIVWIGIAVSTGIYASHRGRSGIGWFFLSLFIPLLAFIIVALAGPPSGVLLDSKGRIAALKKCPKCAEEIRLEAQVCRFCGYEFSPTESRGHGEPEPPLNEPPPEAYKAWAIWNPNAAASWSIIFTPVFGSYLHMLNWRTLIEPAKASSAQSWFYASLLMMFIYASIGMFMSDLRGWACCLSFLYLITWYLAAGRSQSKYVKAKFGTSYQKKPWGQTLLIAVGALIGYTVVGVVAEGVLAKLGVVQP